MTAPIEEPGPYAKAARALTAVAPSLPARERLGVELDDVWRAAERGFFFPDEDERVRAVFARYLSVRAALFETIGDVQREMPALIRSSGARSDVQLKSFAVALCAACMLVRSAWFLVDHFATSPVIWKKLDEAELRFGIRAGQFSSIYRSLTRPAHVVRFFRALRFAKEHESSIASLADHEDIRPVIALLELERPHVVDLKRRTFAVERLSYWKHSLLRRGAFGLKQISAGLFEVSGRVVAEMRNPFKEKRVTPAVRKMAEGVLRPGDVIITRHDDAMSNLFLPGFWPHAALYVGTGSERERLGVPPFAGREFCIIEARKDGILGRRLEETLEVDAFCVIRPLISPKDIARVVERATGHIGKTYDFEFDFRRADRMVCTEVVYRSMHGVGGIEFPLNRRAGRLCLSAEEILARAIDGTVFETLAIFGVDGDQWVTGREAAQVLGKSLGSRQG